MGLNLRHYIVVSYPNRSISLFHQGCKWSEAFNAEHYVRAPSLSDLLQTATQHQATHDPDKELHGHANQMSASND